MSVCSGKFGVGNVLPFDGACVGEPLSVSVLTDPRRPSRGRDGHPSPRLHSGGGPRPAQDRSPLRGPPTPEPFPVRGSVPCWFWGPQSGPPAGWAPTSLRCSPPRLKWEERLKCRAESFPSPRTPEGCDPEGGPGLGVSTNSVCECPAGAGGDPSGSARCSLRFFLPAGDGAGGDPWPARVPGDRSG